MSERRLMRSRYLLVARHPAEVDTLPLSTKVDFPKKKSNWYYPFSKISRTHRSCRRPLSLQLLTCRFEDQLRARSSKTSAGVPFSFNSLVNPGVAKGHLLQASSPPLLPSVNRRFYSTIELLHFLYLETAPNGPQLRARFVAVFPRA